MSQETRFLSHVYLDYFVCICILCNMIRAQLSVIFLSMKMNVEAGATEVQSPSVWKISNSNL